VLAKSLRIAKLSQLLTYIQPTQALHGQQCLGRAGDRRASGKVEDTDAIVESGDEWRVERSG